MELKVSSTLEHDNLSRLIKSLKDQRDWVSEVNDLSLLIDKLDKIGKVTSTRELANVICRSKSWVGVSIILVRGLKLYPEIEKLDNRNQAYTYIQRKQKLRRFMKS